MEIINDKAKALELVKEDGLMLANVSEELKQDPEVVLTAINNDGHALKFADEKFKKSKKVIDFALTKYKYLIIPIDVSTYGDYYRNQFKSENLILSDADDSFRSNEEIVRKAVKSYGPNLQYASDELKKDKSIVLDAINFDFADTGLSYVNAMSFFSADESLLTDKEFVKSAVEKNPLIGKLSFKLPLDEDTKLEIANYGNELYYDIKRRAINGGKISSKIKDYNAYMDDAMFYSQGDLATERRVMLAITPLPYVHLIAKGASFVGHKVKDLAEYVKENSGIMKIKNNLQVKKALYDTKGEFETIDESDSLTNNSTKKM